MFLVSCSSSFDSLEFYSFSYSEVETFPADFYNSLKVTSRIMVLEYAQMSLRCPQLSLMNVVLIVLTC